MANDKRRPAGLIAAIAAIVVLGAMVTSGRLQDMRAVDVVSLLAAGACFGAAITTLLARRR